MTTGKQYSGPTEENEGPGSDAQKKTIEKTRQGRGSTPSVILRRGFQAQLRRDGIFQSVDGVTAASKMLGVAEFRSRVTEGIPGLTSAGGVQGKLSTIAKRRNQVVHEADLPLQEQARDIKLRDTGRAQAEDALLLVEQFVESVDAPFVGYLG